MNTFSRRNILASSSALVLMGPAVARAQGDEPTGREAAPAPARTAPPPGVRNTDWLNYGNDLGGAHYAPLDQINAANFNKLQVAWRFNTDAFGARMDAYYNCEPLIVNGRIYATAGNERYCVCVDGATGQLLWSYKHDEKGRLGTRGGSGWGLSHWTDGKAERIIYVTRSYQMVSLDAKTGLPDPNFGVKGELDLRLDDDQDIDPVKGVIGLHSPPLVIKDTVVVGAAPTAFVKAYVRGFDIRTGKRRWIFHTVPRKGEFGYDTWLQAGQAETTGNTGVWAPMTADPDLNMVYVGVELPPTDDVGVSRQGNTLFSQSMVALDADTGERKWHYQCEHHGLWDRDICAAGILYDLPQPGGKVVKAMAIPSKQAYLYVLDRTTGKPVWPIPEKPVPKGDVPGEWYSPTQPMPSKPPPFDRQGFSEADLIDFTPELKARAVEIAKHYRMGPLHTPPALINQEKGPWATLVLPGTQGGANWPGGAYDPDTGMLYIYSKTAVEGLGVVQGADGKVAQKGGGIPPNTNDNNGGAFGGTAGLTGGSPGLGGTSVRDTNRMTGPIIPSLALEGLCISKPPYGRVTAIDLRKGEIAWWKVHGETPDFIKNHPLLKGVTIPKTGQSGILGTLATKSLVVIGDSGLFTDETGRKAARLRAYDKATGAEVGAVVLDKAQTGTPITYMLGGKQYIVLAIGGVRGAELVAYRLPG